MKRRLIAVAISLAWLAGCGGQSSAPVSVMPQNGAPPGIGSKPDTNVNELPEPPVVRSVNGVAKLSLTVDLSGATGLPQFVFDQQNDVGPTIRVNPGDKIAMDVSDQLPKTRSNKYDINIHFHGMGSSPKAPGDDVLGTFARPGESLHYVVHIPKNQEPGLYWYHPHIHGQTSFQVGSAGMSGAIVVNGLEHHLPGLAKMRERLIILRASGIGATLRRRGGDDVPGMPGMDGMAMPQSQMKPQTYNAQPCGSDLGLTTTLNGAYQPLITIRPGEKQFFRLINATSHKTLKLNVGNEQMELVAIDGFALDSWPGNPPTKMVRTLIVPPAARVEFVVTGPPGGLGIFRTLCYDSGITGDHDPQTKLATLKAPPHQAQLHATVSGPLAVGAPLPSNVYTTALPPIAATRTVVFSEGPNNFFINGKFFKMSDPPMYVVHAGTVEEWHVHNVTQEVHDFHIHQIHFLVKEINGAKLADPYWADSVVIPHRLKDGTPGSLTLIMDFRDPTIKGTFLFHCHILDHEDAGMMAKIQAI